MPDVLETLADKLYEDVKEVAAAVTKAKGLAGLGSIIALVVRKVEDIKAGTAPLTGAQKKGLASDVLNRLVDLPVVPEWLESKVFGVAVDWFVDFFNRTFGKTWKDVVDRIPF